MNTQPHTSQIKVKNAFANRCVDNHYLDVDTNAYGHDPATLTLLSDGNIYTCNQAAGKLFGCLPSAMIGLPITRLLPQVAKAKQFKGKRTVSFLRFLSRIGHRFDVVKMNGTHFPAELIFSEKEYTVRNCMYLFIHPVKQKRHDPK